MSTETTRWAVKLVALPGMLHAPREQWAAFRGLTTTPELAFRYFSYEGAVARQRRISKSLYRNDGYTVEIVEV